MKYILITIILFSFTGCNSTLSQTPKNNNVDVSWITNFNEKLWGFDFINKNEVIVTRKKGKVSIVNLLTKETREVKVTFPNLYVGGQGGLLDVLFHKGSYYFSYSYQNKKGRTTALMKSDLLGNDKVFYIANAYEKTRHHFGSRFVVVGDTLYATIGDRGKRHKAQNLKYDNGKVLSFDLKTLNKKAIFTLGHRNPQGIAYHPKWKTLLNGEFGPQGGDEINLLKKDRNYGWPIITYGEEYGGGKIGKTKQEGLEQPIKYWTPSLSFSGITFYLSKKNKKWNNNLFLACLGSQQLYRVVFNSDLKVIKEESLLGHLRERIRQVRQGLDESLYIITDNGKFGKVVIK